MSTSVRSFQDYARLFLIGLTMGAADVVPGVSGGTIAFISGIYDELLHSLKNLTPKVFWVLKRDGFVAAWKSVNGGFLLAVFAGILVSLKTFAHLITLALDAYPILVWSFFFGLIVASVYYFASKQRDWRWIHWGACALGAATVFLISIAAPAQLPGDWWMLFIGGFIAICAMILPGISGSFLLLLMGLYPVFLAAINDLDLLALLSFGSGCVAGLICFSRFLSWLMDRYHQITMATLVGFLVGSLNVTWPWKHTLVQSVDRHGKVIPLVQENVFPETFLLLRGEDPMVLWACLIFSFGVLLVLTTEYISDYFASRSS